MTTLISVIILVLNIYSFVLLARVIMTWIPNLDPSNPIVRFLHEVTEPVLQPIRNALPNQSGLDFSPMVVFLIIMVVSRMLMTL